MLNRWTFIFVEHGNLKSMHFTENKKRDDNHNSEPLRRKFLELSKG